MALIKAVDMAYGRMRAPDLDLMEEFLVRFGMTRAERTPTALYMRGTDPAHHLHITEKGDPKFVGFAYQAASEDDLARIAKAPGASGIETIDEPGGGRRVRLTEPNGYQIEVVHGIATLAPITLKPRQKLNSGENPLSRAGELMRLPKGPSHVKRIGHGVLNTPKFDETIAWYREMLGFISSDDVYAGDKAHLIGSFNRLDRGSTYVDHHVFFCLRHDKTGLNHLSFEVQDIDDVCMGHNHLKQFGSYEHMWGLGRHLLGSQVYDYWADPWGRVHEHWADSDRLNVASGSNLLPAEEALVSQWGEAPPEKFINHASP
jgi:catechol 2,3-dioxygenase-like lactoylglutathione lyase family enzyme